MLSQSFEVRREILVDVAPAQAFQQIANFATWAKWSPWLSQDSDCPVQIDGKPNTLGHQQRWQSQLSGSGQMRLRTIEQNRELRYEVRLEKPFKSEGTSVFRITPSEGMTSIEWVMRGTLPLYLFFMRSSLTAFFALDCDRGLKLLKDFLEQGTVHHRLEFSPAADSPPFLAAVLSAECRFDEIPERVKKSFADLDMLREDRNLPAPDFHLAIYKELDMQGNKCSYQVGLGYREGFESNFAPPFEKISYPAHQALTVRHWGPLRHLANAWTLAYSQQRLLKVKSHRELRPYEVYEVMPDEGVPEAQVQTVVRIPLFEPKKP